MKKLVILSLSFVSFVSCRYIIEEQLLESAQNNYVTPYKGKYTGAFTGDNSGNLVLNVNKDGLIEVTRINNGTGSQEVSYQNLLGGGSGAISSPTSNTAFTLIGSLETKSGTWKMGSLNGTWNVAKQ